MIILCEVNNFVPRFGWRRRRRGAATEEAKREMNVTEKTP